MKNGSKFLCLLIVLVFALFTCAGALAETDAAEPEAQPGFFESLRENTVVKKLFELKWYTILVLAAIVAFAIVLLWAGAKTKWNSSRIAYAAMCVAIAFVLSYIRFWRSPYGGSVTPASMLPLVAFSVACGPIQGAVVGFAYGLLDLIQDPYVIHPIQLLMDYPIAYGAVALAGLVNYIPVKKFLKLPVAVVLGAFGRWTMAVLSGVIFFAEYAEGGNALLYSMGYNFSYLGPDTLLCVVVALIPGMTRIVETLKGRMRPAVQA